MSNLEYMIVGLGNPGKEYEKTRHNAGFLTLDFLADKYNCSVSTSKFNALIGNCEILGKKVLLMKPQTYMNLSGNAVLSTMSFYKIPPERIILIFDDISFDVGKLRIRKKGSHGGQNGVKNIISLAKSENFPRIKIGVGGKPNEFWDLADWVLSKFSKEEFLKLESVFKNASIAIELIISGEIKKAMSLYN